MQPAVKNEPWYAVAAKFGGVEFWCQSTSDGAPRRIQEIERPWQSGADTADMGGKGRRNALGALLAKSQVKELQRLRDTGQPYQLRHPTLGVWMARLVDCPASTSPDLLNFYQCQLEFIAADPAPSSAQAAPSASASADAARGAAGLFDDALDGLDDIPEQPQGLDDAVSAFGESWEAFDGLIDDVLDDTITTDAGGISAAFGSLTSAIDDVVSLAEEAVDGVTGLAADVVDQALSLRELGQGLASSCRDLVASVEGSVSSWYEVLITSPVDLATVLQGELGAVDDSVIDSVLERALATAGALDPLCMAAGSRIQVPIRAAAA